MKHSVSNPRCDLTADEARRLFSYDPVTGWLTWAGSKRSDLNGTRAGSQHRHGYRYVSIQERQYKEHRLIWLVHFGEWPSDQIDHANGDGADNRIANLRLATATLNQANKGLQKNNTTGFKGVRRKNDGRYFSVIKKQGKVHYLGLFTEPALAHAAYEAAASRLFGKFARAK